MGRHLVRLAVVALLGATVAGCAAGRAFRQGEASARAADWDAAVAYYTRAVQAAPGKAEYKIALERAMQSASHVHLARARDFESKDQLDSALFEYKRAAEYDPANRQAAARVTELERAIRDRIEAGRPKPPITQMRERARQASAEPILNPASRDPLSIRFNNASLRDILNFIANASGINITFDPAFQERAYTVQLDNVTLEQALNQILTANALFYKVLNEHTIIVVPDNAANRAKYEEQVIRTFFVSHSDATELAQIINTVIRGPNMAVQPLIAPNKTSNTITVRATAAVAAIIEQIIETNDKPRAEVVIDVEILEVNRTRAKQFGLNLTQYAVGAIFSPAVAPGQTTTPGGGGTGGGGTTTTTGTPPDGVVSPPPFNLNLISQGVSTADFYLAVPAAIVRFLESDNQTKLVAKPQLRGAEGKKLTLNLGDEIPVPSTTFTPLGAGGVNSQPLTSFNYKPVGINLEITPRVTAEGDIILELVVESSTLGNDVNIAGQNLPSFGSRKVNTTLRLRDGESNLLAGLLREDERRLLSGFPGALHVPILKQLFSANNQSIAQTDIIMLLTPRIVRTHEITQRDLNPIFIGTQQNLGLSGPPPLIAPPAGPEPGAVPPPGTAPDATPLAGAPAGVPSGPIAPAGVPGPPTGAAPGVPGAPGTTGTPVGGSPTPGTVTPPSPATPPSPTPATGVPPAGTPPPATPPAETPPAAPAAPTGAAEILVTPPGTEFRVAGGPYTVPISVSGASRLSTISLTLTFNQAALRVRSVQEGSFLRQGGVGVTFTQQVDATTGRIDITLSRTADAVGASGSGLLAAILFDATAPGTSPLAVSGVAAGPGGASLPLQFSPVTVVVR